MDPRPKSTTPDLNLLRETLLLLQHSAEREKPKLMERYNAQFYELLADLRIKMAASKSGRT